MDYFCRNIIRVFLILCLCAASSLAISQKPAAAGTFNIVIPPKANPRIQYAAEQLRIFLVDKQPGVKVVSKKITAAEPNTIVIGTTDSGSLFADKFQQASDRTPQSFVLQSQGGNSVLIAGFDDAGLFYGCLEFIERIDALTASLPLNLSVRESPKMTMRGTCIGLQRPDVLYGDSLYDNPIVPQTFPWFYDRAIWTRYLDMLAKNRYNTLYFWNGHPFTSLLKLPKYHYAQEVETRQLSANIDQFKWLITEADRRNIRLVMTFYNIHVSHPFAKKHNIPYHHATITPPVAEYTSYCITEFVKNYPTVGLMPCLGETLTEDVPFVTDILMPAIKAGLKPGQPHPPVIIRSHNTDIFNVLPVAKPLYDNLYVAAKYTNETLASDKLSGGTDSNTARHYAWEADGKGHAKLAKMAQLIINVHCLANLEPLRWSGPDYVRRAVTSCVENGAVGLHLFPLRYFDWPYSADKTSPRLLQMDRDWLWFAAWGRYSWNPARNVAEEGQYWTKRLAAVYGSQRGAQLLLIAYDQNANVLPMVTSSFSITSENFLATTLGQTVPQLMQSRRWYASKPGETIAEFAAAEVTQQRHTGQTPLDAAAQMGLYAEGALQAARIASESVTQNKDEFERFLNDLKILRVLARFYGQKVDAAAEALMIRDSNDPNHIDRCLFNLSNSVDSYRELARLTDAAYLDCASLHVGCRMYPYPAPKYLLWSDVLPEFEKELETAKHNAELIRKDPAMRKQVKTGFEKFFTERLDAGK